MAGTVTQKIVRKTLSIVLFFELAAGVVLLARMIPTFPKAGPNQSVELPLWVSLLICVIVAVMWVGVTALGAWRANGGWVRGSTITIHVLMIAAGTGVLQGLMGEHSLYGAGLVVLGAVGIIGAIMWKPKGRSEAQRAVDELPAPQ